MAKLSALAAYVMRCTGNSGIVQCTMHSTVRCTVLLLAVETYGGLGKAARKLRKRIASSTEEGLQMLSESEVMRELKGSVAIAVQKGNANIILAEYHRAMGAAARSGRGAAGAA